MEESFSISREVKDSEIKEDVAKIGPSTVVVKQAEMSELSESIDLEQA